MQICSASTHKRGTLSLREVVKKRARKFVRSERANEEKLKGIRMQSRRLQGTKTNAWDVSVDREAMRGSRSVGCCEKRRARLGTEMCHGKVCRRGGARRGKGAKKEQGR